MPVHILLSLPGSLLHPTKQLKPTEIIKEKGNIQRNCNKHKEMFKKQKNNTEHEISIKTNYAWTEVWTLATFSMALDNMEHTDKLENYYYYSSYQILLGSY